MDWIHCNSCFVQPSRENGNTPKKQFYLTSCGHIFCENCTCYADGTSDCCKYCMNKCSSTVIGEKSFKTNPQVLEYFQEPEEIYENLLKVMKFQKVHRIKLVAHHQNIILKFNRAKLYIKKLEGELKIAKNALRNTPHYSRSVTVPRSITTPIFQPNSTPFNMINAEAKIHNTPANMKSKMPDMKYRKQSLRNELSILSAGSNLTGVSTPGSSVYASPLQEIRNEKCTPTFNNLKLNSFGHKYLKKN